jgi:hypothetical protein
VSDALAQGGYLRVRVAQPEVVVAADGSSVTVRGGGVFFEGATNDPAQPYFLRETLVGGAVTVAVGAELGAPTATDGPPVTTPPQPRTEEASSLPRPPVPGAPSGTAAPAPAASTPEPQLLEQRTVRHAAANRFVWLWFVAAVGTLVVLVAAFRRRLAPLWDDVADRYLRG